MTQRTQSTDKTATAQPARSAEKTEGADKTATAQPAVLNGWEVAPGGAGAWWVRRPGGAGTLSWRFATRAEAVAFARQLRPPSAVGAPAAPSTRASERADLVRLLARLRALAARDPAKAPLARALARKLAACLPGPRRLA